MKRSDVPLQSSKGSLAKSPTGIRGLDEITGGGLPRGRPTLVCGSAGCGKTLLATEFIVRGAAEFDEPGVIVMFEEDADELTKNVRSLGFDLPKLVRQKKIALDYVHVEVGKTTETGPFDLDGLFIRLQAAIESVGAKRIAMDTIEVLFGSLRDHAILRSELRRLFQWLKERGMTAVVTGERGLETLTRTGLEEYVADCVILLDHRVSEQISTRRLRVVKYRGSMHGTNEFPFLIGPTGISILPVTSLGLQHKASSQRVSTGLPQLDAMLGGHGLYRGSSTLVSGTPGTGKSTIALGFVNAACARGERSLMFAYEESEDQLCRNMASVGFDLRKWIRKGLLRIQASRPTLHGLEEHLVQAHNLISDFSPSIVVIDPISNLGITHEQPLLKPMLMRLIDFLKERQVTALFTCLISKEFEESEAEVSSLMDTWLLLRNTEYNGERNRTLYVVKSRGTKHSNQVREFIISSEGLDLVKAYIGQNVVLTGAARVAQEAKERADEESRRNEHQRRVRRMEARRKAIEAQITALRAEASVEADEVRLAEDQDRSAQATDRQNALMMTSLRNGKNGDGAGVGPSQMARKRLAKRPAGRNNYSNGKPPKSER